MTFITIAVFVILLILGIPISLVLGITTVVYFLINGQALLLESTPLRMFSGLENFGLLAIPLFMLMGEIMNEGGITTRLVNFAKLILGHFRGGLAYVTVVANMFLASILGSANAQAAMMSKVMVPQMEKEGYKREFAGAITLASSIIAPIIPPSMIFIIYGTLSSTSIGAMFMAGILPGILYGIAFMMMIAYMGYKHNFPKSERSSFKEILQGVLKTLPALLIPLIVVVGILRGIFTATESAAVACFLAIIIGLFVYRELDIKKFPKMLVNTVTNTATVTFLIIMANIFGWMIAFEQIPQLMADLILSFTESPWVFLLLVNILLLIVGMLIDGIAALVILVPVLMPLVHALQIDPVHFGVIICINLTLGLLTPPVGTGLFIVSSMADIKFERLVKAVFPFIIVSVIVLFIITYIPDLVLVIPRFLGF
ncbi:MULTISPECIES: TRAP transporter large permease [Solibacillus]|uniref:TRAP transporter large permease n=1 Tax=Solibacillus merdavium TaxID=2762218 RepID=A0ABR8XLD4_9BACL|nr:TRAP transporter large permease [Solibacillus merdavium]MBD8032737.1 TRAP transporter large permease [Solibacillus merdavium]